MYNAANHEALKLIGGPLYKALFTDAKDNDLGIALYALLADEAKRVRIDIDVSAAPELARVPWEAFYVPDTDTFLATDTRTNLIRTLNPDRERDPPGAVEGQLRMLVIVANPAGDLDTSIELERIERLINALKTDAARDEIDLFVVPEVNRSNFRDALKHHKPHLIHFIGHGDFRTGKGVINFHAEDDPRRPDPIESDDLRTFLQNARPWLVVLNSCMGASSSIKQPYGGTAQELVRIGVPFVVAMQAPISDEAAIYFARTLYAELTAGTPVPMAVTEGRKALRTHRSALVKAELCTPVLYAPSKPRLNGISRIALAAAVPPVPRATGRGESGSAAWTKLVWPVTIGAVAIAGIVAMTLTSSSDDVRPSAEVVTDRPGKEDTDTLVPDSEPVILPPDSAPIVDSQPFIVAPPVDRTATGTPYISAETPPRLHPDAPEFSVPNPDLTTGPAGMIGMVIHPGTPATMSRAAPVPAEIAQAAEGLAGNEPPVLPVVPGSHDQTQRPPVATLTLITAEDAPAVVTGGDALLNVPRDLHILLVPTAGVSGDGMAQLSKAVSEQYGIEMAHIDHARIVPGPRDARHGAAAAGDVQVFLQPPLDRDYYVGADDFPRATFAMDSADPRGGLEPFGWLARNAIAHGLAVSLVGTTDASGSAAYNLELGWARVEAVRDRLATQLGVPTAYISIASAGETHAAAAYSAAEARGVQGALVLPGAEHVEFAFDEAELTDADRATVDDVADWAKRHEGFQVIVAGHADQVGPADYNLDLSRTRAGAARDALVARGVAADQIIVRAHGESMPLPIGEDVRGTDRRVEFRFWPDTDSKSGG
nr:OmpA family protein [Pacificimonas pallii]